MAGGGDGWWRELICFPDWGAGGRRCGFAWGLRGVGAGWGRGSGQGRGGASGRWVLGLPLHEGALRGSGWLCVQQGGRPGSPRACRRHAQGWGLGACSCVRGNRSPRRARPRVRSRHTHRLKSKGIVPPPPGMGALQARWAAAPRGSQPAANASSGRPAPAGRPPSPTPAARLPPPGSDAPRSPLGAVRPPPASPSAARLKGPAGREGEGRAFGVSAGGGKGREPPKTHSFLRSVPSLSLCGLGQTSASQSSFAFVNHFPWVVRIK